MECCYKCPPNNLAYGRYTMLQRDDIGMEYIKIILYCSKECLNKFIKEETYEDENGYVYCKTLYKEDNKRGVCWADMIEKVIKYKKNLKNKK